MKVSRALTAAGAGLLLGAIVIALHHHRHSLRWVTVPSAGADSFEVHVERRILADRTLYPSRKFLLNFSAASRRPDSSQVHEVQFDCFNERIRVVSAVAFAAWWAEGAAIRMPPHQPPWETIEPALAQAMNSICAPIVRNRADRPVENLPPSGFPIEHFMTCSMYGDTGKNDATLKAMRQKLVPKETGESAWTYRTEGSIVLNSLEIPVLETLLGVCNRQGDIDCGNGMYTALKLGWSMQQAQESLGTLPPPRGGLDYSVAVRDPESQVPLRPYLFADPTHAGRSFLICDSGVL